MLRAGMCFATGVLATIAAWAATEQFTPVEAAPPADPKPAADAKEAKPVDLTALREAIARASKRGENVGEIGKALDAFEKTQPKNTAGRVPPELQALRDAVDDAARKGENVEAITKELVTVEMAVAGKSLAKVRPQPRPQPQPGFQNFPQPGFPNFPQAVPLPAFPIMPNPGIGGGMGGVDVELFNKAMDLRRRAELMLKDPKDADAIKEGRKLQAEASELLLKAARNGLGGGAGGVGGMPAMPLFPEFGRVPDRVRLGIRMERVPAVAVDQLGLEPNTGIAVSMVMAGSAAEKAGLKVHDIILEFAGKPVTDNTEDFARRVANVKAGVKVDLVVLRKGKKVDVKGVELPEEAKQPEFPQAFPRPIPMLPVPGVQAIPAPQLEPRKPLPAQPGNPKALPVNPKPLPVNPPNLPVQVPGLLPLTPQPLPLNPALAGPGGPNG